MDNNYEISDQTLAVLTDGGYNSLILETKDEFIVSKNTKQIIDESCQYFGSSYKGRHEGTKKLIGFSHKAPIIVEESREIVFFPTKSPRLLECNWISLKNIKNYNNHKKGTIITFKNGRELFLDMSYGSFENQLLRATRLSAILRDRKIH